MKLNPHRIKCIVTDLDGTLLLPDARLGRTTISVLNACRERGLRVMLATGRSLLGAESYRSALNLSGPMIYYNGAELVDMPQRTVLVNNLLPNDAAAFCVRLARERGAHFHVFFIDESDASTELLFSENPSKAAEAYAARTGLDFQFGDLLETLNAEKPPVCAKGIFIAPPDELKAIRVIMNEHFGSSLTVVTSAAELLEVLHPRASKGDALKAAMELQGLEPDEVIAFGDEENDITMLQTAGYAVAPANAIPQIKAAAHEIIEAYTEEPVAAFLKKHFLCG